jgi:hypothetical protein
MWTIHNFPSYGIVLGCLGANTKATSMSSMWTWNNQPMVKGIWEINV